MGLLDVIKSCFNSRDECHYDAYKRMTVVHKLYFHIIHFIDRYYAWYKLPVFLGLGYLETRRVLHQNYNLINVSNTSGEQRDSLRLPYRTADGENDDPSNSGAGSTGTFFGRNIKPSPQADKLLEPHPSVVAAKLLARRTFVDTGEQFNMIAASWIQFMIHDWIDHLEDTKQVEMTAPKSVSAECSVKSFKFYCTKEYPTGQHDIKTGYKNIRTPWWDGSVIYGSNSAALSRVRTFKDGHLKIGDDNLLAHDSRGIGISGDVRNTWAGISVLQALFIKEHNAVCDILKKRHDEFGDEELYRHARLVVAAVIAKIHTIDWTVELLKMDTLQAAMRANWYGLLGKSFKDRFGHTGNSVLSGFLGLPKPVNHGVPYSLTEEFVSVYRMHSLLPNTLTIRNMSGEVPVNKMPPIEEDIPMVQLLGNRGEEKLADIGVEKMLVSMGHQACGALVLWNYPNWMKDLVPTDVDGQTRPDHVDLAALEIFRDRERGVARYNEFRRNMLMLPIRMWNDLTDDPETIQVLTEVYGDEVEKLDLLVGMMAEKKIKGYAISETAFFIFLLMASRRLEADRFFTSDFKKEVYTAEGLAWVNKTESLKDVVNRHYAEISEKWLNASSAFSLWSAVPSSQSRLPLYLRTPK